MNSQAFRRQLEIAVEERDQDALNQLELIADLSPTTQQIWQDHLLIERAIADWKLLEALPAALSCVPEAHRTAPQPASSRRSRWQTHPLGWMASCLCLLCAGWYFCAQAPVADSVTDMDSGSRKELLNAQVEAMIASQPSQPSIPPALPTDSLASHPLRSPTTLEGPVSAYSETSGALSSHAIRDYSVALAGQSQVLIPTSVGLFPVFPGVTKSLQFNMQETLETISTLPLEVQEAWRKIYVPTPASGNEEWPIESHRQSAPIPCCAVFVPTLA